MQSYIVEIYYKNTTQSVVFLLAERGGFELPVPLQVHMISSHAHSTTLPPLQDFPIHRTVKEYLKIIPFATFPFPAILEVILNHRLFIFEVDNLINMQYKHATLLLFVILVGTGVLTVAVFERRSALLEQEVAIDQEMYADSLRDQEIAENQANQVADNRIVQFKTAIDRILATPLEAGQYRSFNVDLDGDGTLEFITLTLGVRTETGIIQTIAINGQIQEAVAGNFGGGAVGYFGIVDINKSDKLKAVALSSFIPDAAFSTTFYHWHNGSVATFGVKELTSANWENMQIPGDGTVTASTRALVLDTWFYNAKYKLVDDTLVEQPQTFYARLDPTTTPITALHPQTFQTSPTNKSISMTLAKDESATILGCDRVDQEHQVPVWCKLSDSSGYIGWFDVTKIDLNQFTGFSNAN